MDKFREYQQEMHDRAVVPFNETMNLIESTYYANPMDRRRAIDECLSNYLQAQSYVNQLFVFTDPNKKK